MLSGRSSIELGGGLGELEVNQFFIFFAVWPFLRRVEEELGYSSLENL